MAALNGPIDRGSSNEGVRGWVVYVDLP